MDYIRDYNIEREFFDKLNFRIYSETQGDITLYSCPECNEGKSFGRKHRCHWKYDNDKSFIHCFNCGFALGFESFILKYLGKDEYKKLKEAYGQSKPKYDRNVLNINENEILFSPKSIDRGNIFPIINSEFGMNYLKSRKLEDQHEHFFINEYNNIVIPFLTKNKKFFGYQVRIVENKEFWIKLDDINKKFKSWNFYNVDLNKPVYIFEGIEDALSSGLDNVIASIGKNVSPYIMKQIKEPIICFDNDHDGIKAMAKHVVKYNCKALVYPKDFKFKDMNDILKSGEMNKKEISQFIKDNIQGGVRLRLLALSLSKKDENKRTQVE